MLATSTAQLSTPITKSKIFKLLFAERDRIKFCLLFTFLFALCAHAFCWLNTLYGHDSLLIIQNDWEHQISIGRPFQEAYVAFRGNIVAPWLIGILGTLYLSLTNIIIVKLLDIRSGAFIALTCGSLATCATITLCNATYILDYDIYMLSFFLGTLALYIAVKPQKVAIFVAGLVLCLSIGLYPAFLQSFVALALILGVRSFLRDSTKQGVHLALRVIISCLIGVILYLVALIAFRYFNQVDSSSAYNSISTAFSFGESGMIQAFIHTYTDPIRYLLFPETHAVHIVGAINALLILFIIFAIFCVAKTRRSSKLQIACALGCCLLLPLGEGCVNFGAYGNVHSLMIMSYFLIYPFAFSMAEECFQIIQSRQKTQIAVAGKTAIALLVFIVVISNFIYANQVYTKKDLEYQATFSTMTRLEAKLEALPGYVPGSTPVVFEGAFVYNSFFNSIREGFPPDKNQRPFENGQMTDYAVGLGPQITIHSDEQVQQYYKYILGCPIRIVNAQDLDALSIDYAFEDMPVFPSDGSVIMSNGTAFVKIS